MEIVLNENSLVGQYEGLHKFKKYLEDVFIPFYHGTQRQSSIFYSKSDLYNRKITSSETFQDFISGNVAKGTSVQQTLLRVIHGGNFWDLNSKKDSFSDYVCDDFELLSECIYEAAERDCFVYSFLPGKFDVEDIFVKKDGKEIRVKNIRCLHDWQKLGDNSNSNKIEIDTQYRVVVFKNEEHHPPHFHIINNHGKKLGAYQIPCLEERDVSIPTSEKKNIDLWINGNIEKIIGLWNAVHEDRLVNRIRIDSEFILAIFMEDKGVLNRPVRILYNGSVLGIYSLIDKKFEVTNFPEKDKDRIASKIEENMVKLNDLWDKISL